MARVTYSARTLLDDGTASSVELAPPSISEVTAARAALRAALRFRTNTCVVRCDAWKQTEEITQRITLPMESHDGTKALDADTGRKSENAGAGKAPPRQQ